MQQNLHAPIPEQVKSNLLDRARSLLTDVGELHEGAPSMELGIAAITLRQVVHWLQDIPTHES